MAASPNGMTRFYTILGAVAVVGIGLLGYQLSRPATVSIPANVTIQPSDTAGFRGYLKGSDSAAGGDHGVRGLPVSVLPDVRHPADADDRGAADQDRPAPLALPRLSAAAAPVLPDRRPFRGVRRRAGQVLAPARADLRGAARVGRVAGRRPTSSGATPGEVGLDLAKYDACMSAGKYAGRIQASYEEGTRAGVTSTPTLLVGGRLYKGRFDSDAITRLVDSLAPRAASAR